MILRIDYKDGINVPYILGDATKHEDSLHCSGCKRIFSGEYFCYEGEDFCYKCYKVSHKSYKTLSDLKNVYIVCSRQGPWTPVRHVVSWWRERV